VVLLDTLQQELERLKSNNAQLSETSLLLQTRNDRLTADIKRLSNQLTRKSQLVDRLTAARYDHSVTRELCSHSALTIIISSSSSNDEWATNVEIHLVICFVY